MDAEAGAEPGRVALRLRGVSKTFPGVQALREVDLDIAPGTVHAILGHNGCGKSTLVKALAGVHSPDPGSRAWINGEELNFGHAEDAERLGLRFVHQDLGLVLELGAADNVGLVVGFEQTRFRSILWKRQAATTSELLSRFGISLDPSVPLSRASPPERTAVAIVRALAGWQRGTGVLVLDEPTAALPAREVDELFRLIRDVRDTGTAVMLVSHRLDEVMAIADYATVLRAGRVIWDGPTSGTTADNLVRLIADADIGSTRRSERALAADNDPPEMTIQGRGIAARWLRGVDIQVQRGEIVGVAGLLGSGREELPYVLAGAQTEGVSGTFVVDGVSHRTWSLSKARAFGIAFVPADRAREGIISAFTTRENVTMAGLPGLRRRGFVAPARERAYGREWLRAVHADPDTSERMITTLSGGNQQKTVLARWLSVDPRLLLMSEPTAGVDMGARAVIYSELRRRAADGLAILLSSSDIEDLLAVCDRVIVLRDGVVTAELRHNQITKPAIVGAMEGVHGDWED